MKYFFRKLFTSLRKTIFIGTFVSTLGFYALAGFMYATGLPEIMYIVRILLLFNLTAVLIPALIMMLRSPHKYDAELIGKNFLGPGKSNRVFSDSVEKLMKGEINSALTGFKSIEESCFGSLRQSEQAVLCFYIARCYDVMEYYPNTVMYYEKAQQLGFSHDILPFLLARALGAMGDINEALDIYNTILFEDKNTYKMFVRTDIGRMYLHLSDGRTALKWYNEAIELHENYADALGGAAVAHTILHEFDKGEELYKSALLNHIKDPQGFTEYYKQVQAAALTECHAKEKEMEKELLHS
ncbi:MAG: hypothetical protein IJX77_00645 [Ruminococcus sp.]|nr:hypothetical protein [Ruminococcus sp.]